MTASINGIGQGQMAPEVSEQNGAANAPAGAASENAPSASAGEEVTLSTDAQTTTQLLGAARNASGVNSQAVAQLRAAIQNGTYNVSPDTLARAITGAMKEIAP